MRKKVLLFRVNQGKAEEIRSLCSQLGFELVFVDRMRYGEPLGKLADLPGIYSKVREGEIYGGPELPMEMMVFSGLEEKELETFLEEYRKKGLQPIPIKAVITPFNVGWSAGELFAELMKEHRQLRQ